MAVQRKLTLFDQFEARSKDHPRTLLTDVACASVTQGIGTLLALGYGPDDLNGFCQQTVKAATGIAEQAKTEQAKTENPENPEG